MLSPKVIQVMTAVKVAIPSTITKGHGERPHLGQSFICVVLRASGAV
jgi:hypothetical protein